MRNGKTFDGYPFVHDFGLRCYVYGVDLKFSEFVRFSWTQCAMIHSGFTCTIEEEKGKKQNLISVVVFGVVSSWGSQHKLSINYCPLCRPLL